MIWHLWILLVYQTVILLNKKKREYTNHSYDRCVNEYTMNSLLPIRCFLCATEKKCLDTRKVTSRILLHMYSLSLWLLRGTYCFLRCCNSTKEEQNYVVVDIIHGRINRRREEKKEEEQWSFQHRHRSSVIICMLIQCNHPSRMLVVDYFSTSSSCCCPRYYHQWELQTYRPRLSKVNVVDICKRCIHHHYRHNEEPDVSSNKIDKQGLKSRNKIKNQGLLIFFLSTITS